MRNEELRLDHFLSYYKGLGVDRFFFIDNGSSDSSAEIVLQHPSTHLFVTSDDYTNHWFWMEHLLETYGSSYWCVVVDIDEIFFYPYGENLSIKDLRKYLERHGETAVRSFLLDMYSDTAITDTCYISGDNPLLSIPFFDKDLLEVSRLFFDFENWEYFESTTYQGGVRERIFGAGLPNYLSKISFFKNVDGSYLTQGMHAINRSIVSEVEGVVFHTKFLNDFVGEVQLESLREQHYNKAELYKIFNKKLTSNDGLSLYHNDSEKFVDSNQLVTLDIMRSSNSFEEFVRSLLLLRTT